MPQAKLMEASVLSKEIAAIGKQKVNFENRVQKAATECIGQSVVHRNATPAMQLFDALSGSVRRDALVAFFEKFGQLMWSTADKKLVFLDRTKDKLAWTDEYRNEVATTMWHTLKKETPPKSVYDAAKEIGDTIDRLLKKRVKGIEIKNIGALNAVHAAYAAWVADSFGNKQDEPVQNHPEHGHATKTADNKIVAVTTADRQANLAAQFNGTAAQAAK